MVHIDTLLVVMIHDQLVSFHAAQAKNQGSGLQRQGGFLHGNVHHGAQRAVAGGIDYVSGFQRLRAAPGVNDHVGQVAVFLNAAGESGMVMQFHTGLQQHPLGDQLIDFGIVGNIAQRLFHLRTAQRYHALDKFPGDAAADQLSVIGEYADGQDETGCGHAAGETKLFDHGGFGAAAGRRHGRNPTRGAAAAHYNVVASFYGDAACLGNLFHDCCSFSSVMEKL